MTGSVRVVTGEQRCPSNWKPQVVSQMGFSGHRLQNSALSLEQTSQPVGKPSTAGAAKTSKKNELKPIWTVTLPH